MTLIDTAGGSEAEAGMMPLVVKRKSLVAEDIHLFELVDPQGEPLPAFAAGAHVTVLTPNGLTRRYSLCNPPGETGRYQLAVKREPGGQGGSIEMADRVHEGDVLPTSAPRNHFAMVPGALHTLLIAGGIGITPLLAMVHELRARGGSFQLLYLTRFPQATPFLDLLAQPEIAPHVVVHHDHGDLARSFDLDSWLAGRPQGTHLYCCGPRGLMQAVRAKTTGWPSGSVWFEDFGSSPEPAAAAGEDLPFTVRLVRSGRDVAVPSGISILEALRRENIAVPSSCESGTCGSCRTRLVAGVADHRDYVLDEEEQAHEIMICVSRSAGGVLELDL